MSSGDRSNIPIRPRLCAAPSPNSRALLAFIAGLLLAGSLASGQNTPGVVQGRVFSAISGEGIAGADVRLLIRQRRSSGRAMVPTGISAKDGSFRIDNVPAGSYYINASHPDYANIAQYQTLSVASGQQIFDLSVSLNPLATISGIVTDENSKPLPDIEVAVFSSFTLRGKLQLRQISKAQSNPKGEFVIKKIAAGRFFLNANPGNQNQAASPAGAPEPVRTFYPKALTLESATRLELSPGQNFTDANIRLQTASTFHVRGKIHALTGTLPDGSTVDLTPRDLFSSDGLGFRLNLAPDGTFDFAHVQSGSYTLWLTGSSAETESNRKAGRVHLLARQDVDVQATDQNNVVVAVMPAINLTGQINFAVGALNQNFTSVRVNLVPAGAVGIGTFQSLAVATDGSFSVRDLDPGYYMVRVLNLAAGNYVQSIAFNHQDITVSGMDLLQGGSGEIEIGLHSGAAEVDGSTTSNSPDTQPAAGAALLVPENLGPEAAGVLSTGIRQDGTFIVRNVPPGRYFVYAVETWTSLWQNTDFLHEMERQASSIELDENGHLALRVPLLTLQDLLPIASRLGLTVE